MSERLGINHGAYHGEVIDIDAVLRDVIAAAQKHGWHIEPLAAAPGIDLLTLRRPAAPNARRIYVSAGIHGDEPAGPLAVRELLQSDAWPPQVEFWLCPCLNPSGFPLNRRENRDRKDLNRDYRHFETAEVRTHTEWLRRQPDFDLTLCLHEDWESHGFYLYELNPDNRPSFAQRMIDAVTPVCPIDASPEIEGRPASGGIINPSVDPRSRPQWPEAFFLLQNKTRQSYTLEAPSDFPLQVRINALTAAVKAALVQPAG